MGTVRFGPPTENIASSKMKCFLVFATLAVAAHALPQYYIADTPEVQAAKAQFAAAWNAAAARNAAPVAPIHHAAAPVAQFAPVAPVAVAVNATPQLNLTFMLTSQLNLMFMKKSKLNLTNTLLDPLPQLPLLPQLPPLPQLPSTT